MTDPTKPNHRQLYIDLERAGAAMSSAVFSLVNSCATPSAGTLLHLDSLRRNWDKACGRMQQAEHLAATPAPAVKPRPATTDMQAAIEKVLAASVVGMGSYGPNYDSNKLVSGLRALFAAPQGEASL